MLLTSLMPQMITRLAALPLPESSMKTEAMSSGVYSHRSPLKGFDI